MAYFYPDFRAAELSEAYPEWDVWYVHPITGTITWHTKPKGAPIATHDAESSDALENWLRLQPAPEKASP
jgi:hypothetical protein